jgi:hypothetical protein
MYLCGGLARTLIFIMKNQEFMPYMFDRISEFVEKICESYVEAMSHLLIRLTNLPALKPG